MDVVREKDDFCVFTDLNVNEWFTIGQYSWSVALNN